jgi:hypothetical protein
MVLVMLTFVQNCLVPVGTHRFTTLKCKTVPSLDDRVKNPPTPSSYDADEFPIHNWNVPVLRALVVYDPTQAGQVDTTAMIEKLYEWANAEPRDAKKTVLSRRL